METIGKLIFLIMVVGGIGLGVFQITNQDLGMIDAVSFRKAEPGIDKSTIENYKTKLTQHYSTSPTEISTFKEQVPNQLWGTATEDNPAAPETRSNDNNESATLAATLSYPAIRKEMLYWFNRYHYLLGIEPESENTRVALEQYRKFKRALELQSQ